jgi:glycosyltransferase involved in cell wall biosynthesis
MKNKISIIIPTYNRKKLLQRALASIIQQNYKNIEILVIDDASTQDIKTVVQSFKDDRIIYLKNEQNKGSNFSRNLGLRTANGDYIAFLDDDDYYSNESKFKKQLELFSHNNKLVFVGCGYFDKSMDRKRIPKIRGNISENLLLSFSDIETSTVLIKNEVIKKVGFLDERLPSEQNHDYFYRISKYGEFDYINEVMVIKDNPTIQISSSSKNKLLGYVLFHKKHYGSFKQLAWKKFLFALIKFFVVSFLFLTSTIRKNNLQMVRELDKKFKNININI